MSETQPEQRRAVRSRTVLRGSIIYNNRNSTIECLVRNFGETGAKIIVDEAMSFPQNFELYIAQKGITYLAKVVWRNGNETGVQFVNEVVNNNLIDVGGDMSVHLRDLERENAVLKKKVADLQNQLTRYFETG